MAQHARPVALPGAPHRAGPQGDRPRAPRARAVVGEVRARAGAGRRRRDAHQCAVGIAPGACPRPPPHDVSRSLLAAPRRGQGRQGAAGRRRDCRRAQRSGRRQPRDAAAARRLGPACRREPLAAHPRQSGISVDQHDRGAQLGADGFRRRRPAAGRARRGARQLQVDRAQSAPADRRAASARRRRRRSS